MKKRKSSYQRAVGIALVFCAGAGAFALGQFLYEAYQNRVPSCAKHIREMRRQGYSEREIQAWAGQWIAKKNAVHEGLTDEEMDYCGGEITR